MMVIVNKMIGKCQSCSNSVAPGKGFAYKNGHRWLTACASKACIQRLGLTIPDRVLGGGAERRELLVNGQLFCPYDRDATYLLRSLPPPRGKPSWDKAETCRWVSLADEDLPRVIEVCDKLRVSVPDELRKRMEVGTEDTQLADARAATKGLYDFQRDGVRFLALHKRALLADEMGCGKTIQALVALPNNPRVLLICPASLKYNWRDEAAKWRPDLRVTVLSGRESFKVPERGEIVAINFDILPSFLKPKQKKDEEGRLVFSTSGKPVMEYKIPEELQKDFADVHIIIDEAQRVKNYKTQRAQKVTALTMAAGGDWMLTGTPVENNPPELFGVLEVGRMARTVFGNYQIFFRLFNGQKNRWGGTEWGEPSPEVPERLRRVMLRRLKKEVLKDLPPKRYQYITVNDVGEALSEEMDEALKDWDNNYEEDYLPSFEQFSAVLNKLAEARIPAMLEIVESYEESETPLVVFSAHKAPLHALAKRDGWEIITGDTRATDRHAIVSAFQSGALKGVGVSIAAGGVGLTLTRASDELFVDRLWNPSANIQAEDRCHRIGATGERILIKLLTSNHPLDKRINMLLDKKQRLIEKTMDALVKPKLRGPAAKANIELVCETKEQLRQRVELVDETEEQLAERIERAAREAEEHEAKDKVARILDRERKRALGVSNALPEPELTTKRKALIRDALGFLAAHCDGAVMRDQQGFNKPDAMIGHWLNATGLRDDDEVSLRVAERILSRYYRQLHEAGFDSIWRPELE